jgi:cytochrome c553
VNRKMLLLIAAICSILRPVPYCAAEQAAGESTVERGLKISPVPLSLQGKDRNVVDLGSYLVNALADCGGCHTFPQFLTGGDPFQGTSHSPISPRRNTRHYLAGGRCFGHIISSDLTPNLDTGLPSNMTLAQFITAMHSGKGNSPTLFRIMPWPTYHNMTDRDIGAIYQYLSAIPHAEPCNSTCPPSYANTQDCPNPGPRR